MPILKKKNSTASHAASACNVLHGLVAFLLLLTSLAAMMGVVNTHLTLRGVMFGASSGSLALIAFAVNITLFCKMLGAASHGCCSK